jgi:WD40 repeat protein
MPMPTDDNAAGDIGAEALVRSYVNANPRFVERPWLSDVVDEHLKDRDCRFLLLTGDPGAGKTALIAWLGKQHPSWLRYFIRRDSREPLSGGDGQSLLFAIGHQLARQRPRLFDPSRLEVVVRQHVGDVGPGGRVVGVRIEDLQVSPFYDTALHVEQEGGRVDGAIAGVEAGRVVAHERLLDLQTLQYLALIDPARVLLEEDDAARIVVLVDALDEIRYAPRGEDVLSWLASCPELPENVCFVLTARRDNDLLAPFRAAKQSELREISIDPESPGQHELIRDDLTRFLDGFTAETPIVEALHRNRVSRREFTAAALDRARGNFQYAAALARAIDAAVTATSSSGLPQLLRLDGIPSGLSELYGFFLWRIKHRADLAPVRVSTGPLSEPEAHPAWGALYQPVLAVLALAFESLTHGQIATYGAIDLTALPRAIEDFGQFLEVQPGGRVRLFHATLAEFVTDDARMASGEPFYVDASAWHALIAGRLIRANQDWLTSQDEYALANLPQHLCEGIRLWRGDEARHELTNALAKLLEDHGFMERKAAICGIDELVDDYRQGEPHLGDHARFAQLTKLLHAEAHRLRGWRSEEMPGFFAQQLHNRAVEMVVPGAASSWSTRARDTSGATLLASWRVGAPWEPVATLAGHNDGVSAVALTPDGRRAFSASYDGTVIVWDVEGAQAVHVLAGHESAVVGVCASADGRICISGSADRTLRVWDADAGRCLRTLTGHHGAVSGVAVTSDGRYAVSAGADGTVGVWDVEAGEPLGLLGAHTAPVVAVAITPDGRRAVSGAFDELGIVWDLGTGEPARLLPNHDEEVTCVALTADGASALTGSADETIVFWHLEVPELFWQRAAHAGGVKAVAITPDGSVAASAGNDYTVQIWDGKTHERLATFHGHSGSVDAVTLSEDGTRVVSGAQDRLVKVWAFDALDVAKEDAAHEDWVAAVATAADGRVAYSGAGDGSIKGWDLASGDLRSTIDGGRSAVLSLATSPSGGLLVSGWEDGTIAISDMAEGVVAKELAAHGGPVVVLALLDDGSRMVSASRDGTVKMWDLPSYRTTRTLETELSAFALAAGSGLAVSAAGTDLTVWDLEAGERLRSIRPGHETDIVDVAVDRDARVGISCSFDRTVLWDPATGETRATLIQRSEPTTFATLTAFATVVALTPDGRWAIAALEDTSLELYEVSTGVRRAVTYLAGAPRCLGVSDPGTVFGGDLTGGVWIYRLTTSRPPAHDVR